MSQGLDQACPPALVDGAELALELTPRLAALGLGFGVDEIGEPFGRGELELAVLEGAAGKFPRLRQTQPLQAPESVGDRRLDRAPTMEVELGHILAGEALGRGKPQAQPVIEDLAGGGRAQAHPNGATRRRQGATGEIDERPRGPGPGDAEHGDTGPTGGTRQGKDGLFPQDVSPMPKAYATSVALAVPGHWPPSFVQQRRQSPPPAVGKGSGHIMRHDLHRPHG